MQRQHKDRKVVLVSKDIALRLKAKSLDIIAEDYLTGKVRDVREKLYTGRTVMEDVDETLINTLFEQGSLPVEEVGLEKPSGNHFFILKHKKKSILSKYESAHGGRVARGEAERVRYQPEER
ncbi:MAG: PIN domain-containing protein [Flavobacteriales bacterium]